MKSCLVPSILTAACLLLLNACTPPKPPTPPPARVTVAPPVSATVTNWDEFPGRLEAVESVELRARVSGYIDSVHFADGAEVQAGDLLFRIDAKPYQATLDRAVAELHRAEVRLELARNDLQRAEVLRRTKAVSDEEYDTRSKGAREAEAAVASARAAEAAARIDLGYTEITAPVSGRIGRRLVTPGNLVQGGGMAPGTVLASLVTLDPVHCYFDVPERSVARYRDLARTPEGLACELGLAEESGFPHRGRIDFFDNTVSPGTGTLRLRGVLTNPDRSLVPGMFARVRIPAGPPAPALLVPAVAIASNQGMKLVLVVNRSNIVEIRPVVVGRPQGAMQAVTGPLQLTDRVVINGLMMARPGAQVEPVEATAAPTSAAAPK